MREIINGLKLTPSLGVHLSQATALKIARCLEELECENSLLRAEKKFQKTFYAQQPEWISVEERLPEEKQNVLAYDINDVGIIYIAFYFDGLWRQDDIPHVGVDTISHWMPLPEPPKPKEPTFKDVFLKAFPKAPIDEDGYPHCCIDDVFPNTNRPACNCCSDCWNQPYFEPEEEGSE